ncbi:hypothetical protein V8C86DRAFT_302436 [Haematococcus lacustris]
MFGCMCAVWVVTTLQVQGMADSKLHTAGEKVASEAAHIQAGAASMLGTFSCCYANATMSLQNTFMSERGKPVFPTTMWVPVRAADKKLFFSSATPSSLSLCGTVTALLQHNTSMAYAHYGKPCLTFHDTCLSNQPAGPPACTIKPETRMSRCPATHFHSRTCNGCGAWLWCRVCRYIMVGVLMCMVRVPLVGVPFGRSALCPLVGVPFGSARVSDIASL